MGVEFHAVIDLGTIIGSVLTALGFLVGATAIVISVRSNVGSLGNRLAAVEIEIKKLVDVLVTQGRQDEQISGLRTQIAQQGARLDELAHGRGFVEARPPARRG